MRKARILATWGYDYDYREDESYDRPMHEECDAPIVLVNNRYICLCCKREASVTSDMKKWIDDREGEKTVFEECFKCGAKSMTCHYHKNAVTLKWQLGWAECSECGCKIIV